MKLWKMFWCSYHYEMNRYHMLRFEKYHNAILNVNADSHYMNQYCVMKKIAQIVTRLISWFMWW